MKQKDGVQQKQMKMEFISLVTQLGDIVRLDAIQKSFQMNL